MGFYESVRTFWEKRSSPQDYLWNPRREEKRTFVRNYIHKGDVVLDLGCGDGDISRFSAAMASRVVAVDYVNALDEPLPNVSFVKSDLRGYQTLEKFDVILMLGLSPYFQDDDLRSMYAKARSWLRPGGRLLLEHQSTVTHHEKLVNGYSDQLKEHYCALYRPVEKDLEFLSKAGFSVAHRPFGAQKWPDTAFFSFVCRLNPRVNLGGDYLSPTWDSLHERILKKPLDVTGCKLLLERFHDAVKPRTCMLSYGTLLGAIRERGFMDHDTDIDVVMFEKESDGLLSDLRSKGVTVERVIRVNEERGDLLVSCSIPGRDCYIDAYILLWEPEGYKYVTTGIEKDKEKFNLTFDEASPVEHEFCGRKYQIPPNAEAILARWYGTDWKIPKCMFFEHRKEFMK